MFALGNGLAAVEPGTGLLEQLAYFRQREAQGPHLLRSLGLGLAVVAPRPLSQDAVALSG
jgi:hypothetical protein